MGYRKNYHKLQLFPESPAFADGFGPAPKIIKFLKKPASNKTAGVVSLSIAASLVILLGIVAFPSFFYSPLPDQTALIAPTQTQTVKTSSIVAGGYPVQWTTLVKKSDINSNQYLLKLPKSAKNIKITTVTAKQAAATLKAKPTEQQLSLKQKEQLARANQPKSFFVASLFNSISKYFLSSVEDGVSSVVEQITQPEIQPTPDAKLVDLSSEASSTSPEPTPSTQDLPSISETTSPSDLTPVAETPVVEPAPEEVPVVEPTPEEPATELTAETTTNTDEVVQVTFETPAPTITEQETNTGKTVTISVPDESSSLNPNPSTLNPNQYTNVLAYTQLDNTIPVGEGDLIKLYHQKEGGGQDPVDFIIYDTNDDWMIDYIEWTVPHLSEQVYVVDTNNTEASNAAPGELVDQRTYTQNVFDLGNGSKNYKIHTGQINYKDKNNDFQKIDTSLHPISGGQVLTKASYYAKLPDYADDWFKFYNNYEGANQTIKAKPVTSHVEGEVFNNQTDGNYVLYKDAFGQGIDLKTYAYWGGLKKEVVINQKPTTSQDLTFDFELDIPQNATITKADGTEWDKSSPLDFTGTQISIGDSFIRQASVWDSRRSTADYTIRPINQPVDIQLYTENGKTYLRKTITQDILDKAVYPLMTDDTTTYYVGSGDGSITTGGSGSWASVHDDTTGGTADTLSTVALADAEGALLGYSIKRAFFPIDTSGITDTDTIDSAIFYGYESNQNSCGLATCQVDVVQTSQASTSLLVSSDFDNVGSVDGGHYWNNAHAADWQIYTLNATGLTWINKTGYSLLGLRSDDDLTNNSGLQGICYMGINTSRAASNQPYIDITTTAAPSNTAPAIGTGPSDGGSSTATPTISGSNVTFTATATDTESDNYYLAVCKTDAITPVNSDAPTCATDQTWCVSGSTASASAATCNFATTSANVGSNTWYAFVCDNNAASACSVSAQGAGNNGSPFIVGDTYTWDGSDSTAWATAGNWTSDSGGVPGATSAVVINGTYTNAPTLSAATTIASLTISGATVLTFNVANTTKDSPALTVSGNVDISDTANLTHTVNTTTALGDKYELTMSVGGNFTLGATATMNADGKGYSVNNGPGKHSSGYTGGSYGGLSALGIYTALFGATYGSLTSPVNLGSGGDGGAGGGAIVLNISGATDISGAISASGAAGGGSGGSVYITTGTISGGGTVVANGGSATNNQRGAGGGGRVALILTGTGADFSSFTPATLSAYGGTGTYAGAAGTIYKETQAQTGGQGVITIDNNNVVAAVGITTAIPSGQSWTVPNITLNRGGTIGIPSGATLDLTAVTVTFDSTNYNTGITLGGGTLTIPAGAFSYANYIFTILSTSVFNPTSLTIGNHAQFVSAVAHTFNGDFTVDSGGSFTAAGSAVITVNGNVSVSGDMNHLANSSAETYKLNFTVNGNFTLGATGTINVTGKGYTTNQGPGRNNEGGGSYGGLGSRGIYTALFGVTYDSVTAPANIGSGGSSGAGGGAIVLNISGATDISGAISASGTAACGGSGGSVYITTGTISGGGTVVANGGSAPNNQRGAGGGGRVAIILTGTNADFSSFTPTTLSAYGGTGTYAGAAGTVYKKAQAQTYGDLTVDNNSVTTGAGVVTDLSGSAVVSITINSLTISNKGSLQVGSDDALTITGIGETLVVNTGTTLTNNGTVAAAGNWTNSGTFTSGTGSAVTFNGASQTISGSNAFYNLTKSVTSADTLTFTAGTTQTISNTLTLNGASGQLLSLRSSSSPTQWNINPQGTRTISYLDVKDSNNTNATAINAVGTNSTNSGNLTNWLFNTAPTLTSIADSPDPIKGGETITITPTGQGDGESDTLKYYCNETGSATISDTLCTQANASYTSPYSTMTCTYAVATGNATRTVYCRTYDGTVYGTERTTTYLVDSTTPTTTDNFTNNDSWQSVSQTITLTPTDAGGSGIAYTKYCQDTNNTCTVSSGTAYTVPVTISTEGTSYFRYASEDNAGNTQTTVSKTVKIDTTAPVTVADAGSYTFNSWTSSNVTVSLACSDGSGSSCSATLYCTDPSTGSGPSACTPNLVYTVPVTILTKGTSYIRYASTDLVSNSETVKTQTINISNAPTDLIIFADSTSQLTANWSANGNPADTQYYIENITNSTNFGWTTSTTWVTSGLTCGTSYSFRVKARSADLAETSWSSTTTKSTMNCGGSGGLISGGGGATVPPPEPVVVPTNNGTTNPASTPASGVADAVTNIANQIAIIGRQIAGLFGGSQTPLIPQETPEALQGLKIMDINPLGKFALSQVGTDIGFFASKLPQLKKVLDALAINLNNLSDIKRLGQTELYLPGLTQTVLSPAENLQADAIAGIKGVPLAELSAKVISKMPSNIVFAKASGGLIDFSSVLSVDDKGKTQQKIRAISGKPIQLVIKPDNPASRVTGLITLKSLASASQPSKNVFTKLFTAALMVANPVPTAQNSAVSGLLVQKFEYKEIKSGVFAAEINAPSAEGEYEVSTIAEYKDVSLTATETSLTLLVDPEGYVYKQTSEGKLRIQNAIVSIHWLNPDTEKYELWPADKFLQKNPIITNDTGKYSFLVPQGTYYLTATSPNYLDYKSDTFSIKEDNGVTMDIELKTKTLMPEWLNWSTMIIILLLIIIILILTILWTKKRFS